MTGGFHTESTGSRGRARGSRHCLALVVWIAPKQTAQFSAYRALDDVYVLCVAFGLALWSRQLKARRGDDRPVVDLCSQAHSFLPTDRKSLYLFFTSRC